LTVPAREIASSLDPDKSQALPVFHPYMGCDTFLVVHKGQEDSLGDLESFCRGNCYFTCAFWWTYRSLKIKWPCWNILRYCYIIRIAVISTLMKLAKNYSLLKDGP